MCAAGCPSLARAPYLAGGEEKKWQRRAQPRAGKGRCSSCGLRELVAKPPPLASSWTFPSEALLADQSPAFAFPGTPPLPSGCPLARHEERGRVARASLAGAQRLFAAPPPYTHTPRARPLCLLSGATAAALHALPSLEVSPTLLTEPTGCPAPQADTRRAAPLDSGAAFVSVGPELCEVSARPSTRGGKVGSAQLERSGMAPWGG